MMYDGQRLGVGSHVPAVVMPVLDRRCNRSTGIALVTGCDPLTIVLATLPGVTQDPRRQ